MNALNYLLTMVWALLVMLPIVASAARRPNILLLVVDDMGLSDPGFYGSSIGRSWKSFILITQMVKDENKRES